MPAFARVFRPSHRVLAPERMDCAPPEIAAPCLRDLVRINRVFGGHRVLCSVLGSVLRADEAASLLDIGAASGDAASAICARWPRVRVTSLDRRPLHLSPAPQPRIAADVFRLPFGPASFDIVHCGLFLHHFEDRHVVEIIGNMLRVARRAAILVDLERRAIPYYILPASRWLFRWQDLTVSDGRISVQAGFRAAELLSLARAAGARHIRLRRHHPWFRLSAVLRM